MMVEYEENEAGEFVEKENFSPSPSPTPSPSPKTPELSEEGEIIDSDDQVCIQYIDIIFLESLSMYCKIRHLKLQCNR